MSIQVSYFTDFSLFLCENFPIFAIQINTFTGDFRMFDWGSYRNSRIYNTRKPPAYKLRKITSPVALFWAQNDWLSQKEVSIRNESTRWTFLVIHNQFHRVSGHREIIKKTSQRCWHVSSAIAFFQPHGFLIRHRRERFGLQTSLKIIEEVFFNG